MKLEIGQRVQVRAADEQTWVEGYLLALGEKAPARDGDAQTEGYLLALGEHRVWVEPDRVRPHVEDHPDSKAVDRFAQAMKERLYEARRKGRGDWDKPDDCTDDLLAKLLLKNTVTGDPVDVANLAMMLFTRRARQGTLADAALAFQEKVAAPLREELEDIKQLCIDAGCTEPAGDYSPAAICFVEELRQRTVCKAPYHPLENIDPEDLLKFLKLCVDCEVDVFVDTAGVREVWRTLCGDKNPFEDAL